MGLLLNIDTSMEIASVSLSRDGKILSMDSNPYWKDHAAWLHPAIEALMKKVGHSFPDFDAVSVSIGPGSYTGLRVGLAAAKGFCFALKIPLIAVETLSILAHSVKDEAIDLIGPLIDARRMEVFGTVYDKNLMEKIAPMAMILHVDSFQSLLARHKILFCGSGSEKLKAIISNSNAGFIEIGETAYSLAMLADKSFEKKKFAELANVEPLYLKDFHSTTKKD